MITTVEATIWALLARLGIRTIGFDRTLRIFDAVPVARRERPVDLSGARFRGAGACLALSLAQSQVHHVRRASSRIAIGVTGPLDRFTAHAWLVGHGDDQGHDPLRVIERRGGSRSFD